jgi:hypothetical protein
VTPFGLAHPGPPGDLLLGVGQGVAGALRPGNGGLELDGIGFPGATAGAAPAVTIDVVLTAICRNRPNTPRPCQVKLPSFSSAATHEGVTQHILGRRWIAEPGPDHHGMDGSRRSLRAGCQTRE